MVFVPGKAKKAKKGKKAGKASAAGAAAATSQAVEPATATVNSKAEVNGVNGKQQATPESKPDEKPEEEQILVTTSTAESEDDEDEKPLAAKKATKAVKAAKAAKASGHQDSETPKKTSPQQPKGLVDSLSKYFTPGDKRTSRTALAAASPVKLTSVDMKSPEKVGSVKRKRSSASAALVSSSEDDR